MSILPQRTAGQRLKTLDVVAAALGGFSFLVAFLPFYTTGNNGISGYALGTPTSAAIGFSILAGLLCGAGLLPNRSGMASRYGEPLPAAAALTALLLAIANLVSKGNLSGDVSFGFVLFLLGLFIQAALLLYLWLAAIERISAGAPPADQRFGDGRSMPAPQQSVPYRSQPQPPQGPFYPGVSPAPQYPDQPFGPFYPPQR